jgi:alanyl aminopeptidase
MPNADAAGYYRWRLPPEDLRKLTGSAYRELSVRERISVAENVRAAMHAGTITFADGMAIIAPLAADADPQVAALPLDVLTSARDDLVRDVARERVERIGRQLYRPVARRLGWTSRPGETLPVQRFRARVLTFLAFTARDREVLAEAARRGRAYAGIEDGEFHPQAIDAGLAALAMGAAVQQGGAKLFDALLSRLPSVHDSALRRRILAALSATDDPALRERVLSLPLDARLRKNERVEVLFDVAGHAESRDAAWKALEREFDRLAEVVPEAHASRAMALAGQFCDEAHLHEAQDFFGPRAPRIPAGARELAETLERVRLCIAYRDAQGASAERFFARATTPAAR